MQTFDAALPRSGFWAAVIVPPAIFIVLLQFWANGLANGEIGIRGTLLMVALAQGMPLLALGWTIFSTAAYSIAPGKLVIHSVIRDREFSLATLADPPRLASGVITLHLHRRIRLRVEQPTVCLDALRAALPEGSRG